MEERGRAKKIFEAFAIYDNSIIHWEKMRVAFGEKADETKAARDLIGEARQDLIQALMKIIQDELKND